MLTINIGIIRKRNLEVSLWKLRWTQVTPSWGATLRSEISPKLMMMSEKVLTCGHVMYGPRSGISDDNLIIWGLFKSGRAELAPMKIRNLFCAPRFNPNVSVYFSCCRPMYHFRSFMNVSLVYVHLQEKY